MFGKKPVSTYFTYVRVTESGTSFSDLHAVVHAWQPIQRVWSITFAQRGAGAASVVVVVMPGIGVIAVLRGQTTPLGDEHPQGAFGTRESGRHPVGDPSTKRSARRRIEIGRAHV